MKRSEPLPFFDIVPSRGRLRLNLRELWHYRELLGVLVWRDIKVRYKQTVIGGAWAILQPFLTMVLFSIIFGRLAKMPSDGLPYPIFTYAALLPWQLFAFALTESSNSLISNQHLITKVYFPRIIIPLAAVVSGLVDFSISFIILLVMMLFYGIVPSLALLTLPLFILLTLVTAFAVGLWLSALNVEYRDVRYTIPFLTQFWFFLTPVTYSSNLVPEQWRLIYALNPMVGAVEGFRWALLNHTSNIGPIALVSVVVVIVLLISGLAYFGRMEDTFADKV